jgi:hypothetical protein
MAFWLNQSVGASGFTSPQRGEVDLRQQIG